MGPSGLVVVVVVAAVLGEDCEVPAIQGCLEEHPIVLAVAAVVGVAAAVENLVQDSYSFHMDCLLWVAVACSQVGTGCWAMDESAEVLVFGLEEADLAGSGMADRCDHLVAAGEGVFAGTQGVRSFQGPQVGSGCRDILADVVDTALVGWGCLEEARLVHLTMNTEIEHQGQVQTETQLCSWPVPRCWYWCLIFAARLL